MLYSKTSEYYKLSLQITTISKQEAVVFKNELPCSHGSSNKDFELNVCKDL